MTAKPGRQDAIEGELRAALVEISALSDVLAMHLAWQDDGCGTVYAVFASRAADIATSIHMEPVWVLLAQHLETAPRIRTFARVSNLL